MLDLDFIRPQFPALEDPSSGRWAMLENAGGSYMCKPVIDRMTEYITRHRVQPYGRFGPSIAAGQAMDAGREKMATMLGIDDDELVLGPSTTSNIYALAAAIGPTLKPGDEVVVTNQDHEANIGAWRRLKAHGATIREWKINQEHGCLMADDLDEILSKNTALVCFPHCSNIVGAINPARDIIARAHAVGAKVMVDGVSYAPHALPDPVSLGADFYAFSLYKTYGPHLGLMYVNRAHIKELANQRHYFKDDHLTASARIDVAGPNHASVAACAGVAEYYDAVYNHHFDVFLETPQARAAAVFSLFADHEERICERIVSFLRNQPGVRLIGPQTGDRTVRMPTIAFVAETPADQIVEALAAKHIGVRDDHFYATRCLQALGIELSSGVVRISAVHYNTDEDIDRLLHGLAEVL